MTVREARAATDMPRIIEIFSAALARSSLADVEGGAVNETVAKRLVMAAIMRHGRHGAGSFLALVSEVAGRVEGVLIAAKEPIHVIGNRLYATDLLFICEAGADPRDPYRMAAAMKAWAEADPECVLLKVGVTSELGTDPDRSGRIWQRLGARRIGAIYEVRI